VTNNCYSTRNRKSLRNARLVLAWFSVAVLLPFAAAGCSHKGEANAAEDQSQGMEVGTANPKRKDLTREINQPGYLRPYEQTPIYTKIAGFAKEPKFDIGDRVKKGELLVELYVPEVVQDLRVKAAKVDQAKADLKQAKEAALAAKAGREAARADIEAKLAAIRSADAQVLRWQAEETRSRMLLAKGIYDKQTADEQINQLRASEAAHDEAKAKWMSATATFEQAAARYNKAEADVDVAVASVTVAEATHDQWRDWLSYAQITAPFDGVITHRNVHNGHFLQPSNSGSTSKAAEPLFVMMYTDIMRCVVDVPELDALLVKVGDKVLIHFQAMPGVETLGEVTRFTNALNEKSRTLGVEVHLKNPDNKLLPGMYANVTILAKVPEAWALPPIAVMNDILANGDRNYCYVVENGKARKTFLQVGARCDEGLQILRKQQAGKETWDNITGKEVVVVTNNNALQEGQALQVRAPQTH
jgi:HlyD family secretion protein